MFDSTEKKMLEHKAAKIVALINMENWTEALIQTQLVAGEIIEVRNIEIKKGNYHS
ncbi:hypothetical protein KJ934_00305 [Patescibacteria group bacterium]|nr:hypothetical protein [Patescibacteria group bacterium]MBU4477458.1 hypothetical protein [Patescibacteria group bacterium]MCG2699132.1 hypothetical protein [Candidatus Parcubacteria bacterium]